MPSFSLRVAQARRDLAMLAAGLRGQRAPATVPRRVRRRPPDGEARSLQAGPGVGEPAGTLPDDAKVQRSAARQRAASPHPTPGLPVVFVRGRERDTVVVQPGQTLLEAGRAAGLDLPFSCTVGGCGACRLRLTSGEVIMEEPHCLSPEERAAGEVLACIARPLAASALELP